MRCFLLLVLMGLSGLVEGQEVKWEGPPVDFSHGRLIVSGNHRFLMFEDGTPFFYLGDTAWELFHRLTEAETEVYLENRREKGFTVIQSVILAELDGLKTPDAEGETPLVDDDPTRLNEAYFRHVDQVIRLAGEKGLFIGLLPTWGDKVDQRWGLGPVIFNEKNAFAYGQLLGKRYQGFKNIIWINGGDRGGGDNNRKVWEALAHGIKSEDPNHLMTYHPWGEASSSQWFRNSDWLDFNMMQTGHAQRSYAIYRRLMVPDYALEPVKPVLDGEPRYEDHPQAWKPEVFGWFDDADVRQAVYWGVFSGGCGTTYGCHAVWQMLDAGRQPVGLARHTWKEDLDLPGAWDMIHLRRLIESRPFLESFPFQEMIKNEYVPETDYLVARRGKDYVMVYIPTGWDARLDMDLCGWKEIRGWWYNCRDGSVEPVAEVKNSGIQSFSTPTKGRGNDWVLVLDQARAGFKAPGSNRVND